MAVEGDHKLDCKVCESAIADQGDETSGMCVKHPTLTMRLIISFNLILKQVGT